MNKDEYVNEVININDEELLKKMIEQNYFLSKTATMKYKVLKKAFIFSGIGYIGLIIAGLFWVFGV